METSTEDAEERRTLKQKESREQHPEPVMPDTAERHDEERPGSEQNSNQDSGAGN